MKINSKKFLENILYICPDDITVETVFRFNRDKDNPIEKFGNITEASIAYDENGATLKLYVTPSENNN